MNVIHTEKYRGYAIKIIQDEIPESPRTWGNLSTMVCFHKKYNLGDEHDYRQDDFNSWDELKTKIKLLEKPAIILPLGLYDHSGITMYIGDSHDNWDGGQVGFIFISKENARKEFGWKNLTKDRLARLTKCLEEEVQEYDDYLTGNIYGYITEDSQGVKIDSSWGHVGDYESSGIITDAQAAIDRHLKVKDEKKQSKLKQLIKNHVPVDVRPNILSII